MIAVLPLGVVDRAEFPQHLQVVRLAAGQRADEGTAVAGQRAPAEVLAVEHGLRLHELLVEAMQRQARRQHRVLDVEQAVVVRGELAGLGQPRLGAGVRRCHREVHDLRHGQRPVAHSGEAGLVPVGVGDDVDGHGEAQLARDFQRLHVGVGGDALAVALERLGVERLHAEEHVEQAQLPPVGEHVLVLEQHVAARLQVVLLADVAPLHLAADGEAVLGVDEGHVVHEEHVGLADARQVLGGRLR